MRGLPLPAFRRGSYGYEAASAGLPQHLEAALVALAQSPGITEGPLPPPPP